MSGLLECYSHTASACGLYLAMYLFTKCQMSRLNSVSSIYMATVSYLSTWILTWHHWTRQKFLHSCQSANYYKCGALLHDITACHCLKGDFTNLVSHCGSILHQQARVMNAGKNRTWIMTLRFCAEKQLAFCVCPARQLNCSTLELSQSLIDAIRQASHKVKH